jgi:hypothetical protein
MVAWASDSKRWGALPLGESPKELGSLSEPEASPLRSGLTEAASVVSSASGSESDTEGCRLSEKATVRVDVPCNAGIARRGESTR